MSKELNAVFGDKNVPSEINNPFLKSCIESISLRADRKLFSGEMYFYGTVRFKNGNTVGEQRIDADNLSDLFNKVYKFCESLS